MLRSRLVRPALVVDISGIQSLGSIEPRASWVDVGAMVTHEAFAAWAVTKGQEMITEAAGFIGNPAIRTMGTVAGSLAHADPSAEWGAVALALRAECTVVGPAGQRVVPVLDLFSGPFTTTLHSNEMISRVRFRLPGKSTGANFLEVAPRRGDPAVAGVAAVIRVTSSGRISKAYIGLAGLAATPVRASSVEAALVGLSVDADFAVPAREVGGDISPLTDVHASDAYRRRVAPTVVARTVRGAVERAVVLKVDAHD